MKRFFAGWQSRGMPEPAALLDCTHTLLHSKCIVTNARRMASRRCPWLPRFPRPCAPWETQEPTAQTLSRHVPHTSTSLVWSLPQTTKKAGPQRAGFIRIIAWIKRGPRGRAGDYVDDAAAASGFAASSAKSTSERAGTASFNTGANSVNCESASANSFAGGVLAGSTSCA